MLLPPRLEAQYSPGELKGDFVRLMNEFIKQWNLFSNLVIDDRRDLKVTEELVKGFERLVDHPYWPGRKK